MAGIYIPGMEMPRDCMSCQFAVDGSCVAMNPVRTRNWSARETTNYCPLVPVPKHGRLIDADALMKELALDDDDPNNGATLLMAVFLEVLKTAPTVIPADDFVDATKMAEGG